MPNGHDKNWVRVCVTVEGFRARYGRWPTRISVPAVVMDDFKFLFTARDLLTMTRKIQFVVSDDPIVAEDDDGGRFAYGDPCPDDLMNVNAREWFGIEPRSDLPHA